MSSELYTVLAYTFMLAFIICCMVSAMLQIIAWSRHTPEGVRVRVRAIWKPETGGFDAVGLRQMRLARGLLMIGICAYLLFGALVVVARVAVPGGAT